MEDDSSDENYFRSALYIISAEPMQLNDLSHNEYENQHVSLDQMDSLITRYVDRVSKNRQNLVENSYIVLGILKSLTSNKTNIEQFERLFRLVSFTRLLRTLRKDEHKLEAGRYILESMYLILKFNRSNLKTEIRNSATINFLLALFKTVNECTVLILDPDDNEHVSQLVVCLLDSISFDDSRSRLDFYSRCRAVSGNLSPVLEYLAKQSFKLATDYMKVESKRRLRRDLLDGCLAFSYVTILAIYSAPAKLELIIEGSRLALERTSLSLADYYLRLCLENLDEQCSTSHQVLYSSRLDLRKAAAILLSQVERMIGLFAQFQDQIDIEHKLNLKHIVQSTFSSRAQLIDRLKEIRVLDTEESGDEAAL